MADIEVQTLPPPYDPARLPRFTQIDHSHSISSILLQPVIVVRRQKNRNKLGLLKPTNYHISDTHGNFLGTLEEEESDLPKFLLQNGSGRKSFNVVVRDKERSVVARIRRDYSVFKNETKIFVPSKTRKGYSKLLGLCTQEWNASRDRYILSLNRGHETFEKFGTADAHLNSFTLEIRDTSSRLIGLLDRNWVGLAKKKNIDRGTYLLKMEGGNFLQELVSSEVISSESLTLDQRAILLGMIISLDFDFFTGINKGRGAHVLQG